MNKILSHSEQETTEFASNFAKSIASGTIIALHGSLGAGKTVFSRGFARGLGIVDPIPSPTFTIVQEYEIRTDVSSSAGKRWLFHMDLYRIADSSAALAFGIDDYLYDPHAIKLIEWSDRIADLLPDNTMDVHINHVDEMSREIKFA